MFSRFRVKKNSLPCSLVDIHEKSVRDIFNHFEKGRLIRKQLKQARKSIKGALRFAKRKKAFPSRKTEEALAALAHINDELVYTQRVIRMAFEEVEKIIKTIHEERIGEIAPLVERAKEEYRNHNTQAGNDILQDIQDKLGNNYLPRSRKAFLAGIDSDLKRLKQEMTDNA